MIEYSEIQEVVHGRKLLKGRYQVGSHAIKSGRQTLINAAEVVIAELITLFRSVQGGFACSNHAGVPENY